MSDSSDQGPKTPIPADPMIGRVFLGRYEVLKKIGSGGMGAVYVAIQKGVEREVAVKILRGDLMSNELVRERFRREAEIIGKLRHPNTIQLIDYGETEDGLALMVMELLVGTPLNEQLKGSGSMSLAESIQIGIDVASSLAEAHEAGLVHRDLKPGNIFLVDVGGQVHAKVLDFGIARILDEEATRITSTGQVFGTPRYMSPEQGMATGEVDARSDLYSLGLIIYECLVGQPPFVAQTSIQYLSAHATMPPPKLSQSIKEQIPYELEQLVDACLIKQATQRIQTARDVVEALKIIASGVDQKQRMETGQVASVGQSAIASFLPDTIAPSTVPENAPPGAAPIGIHTEAPSTVVADQSKKSPVLLVVGFAFLCLALIIVFAVSQKSKVEVSSMVVPDAGEVAEVQPRQVDVGFAPAVVPDAGVVTETDSGIVVAVKPDAKVRRKKRTPKRVRPKPPSSKPENHALPGSGGISGPRGMMIQVEVDQEILNAAKACKTSSLPPGPGKLKLTGCAKSCAVLLDGDCAGRTPLKQSSFKKGNKSLSVVCGGKLVIDEIARLRDGKIASFSCK